MIPCFCHSVIVFIIPGLVSLKLDNIYIINVSQLHKSAIAKVQVFVVVINNVIFVIIFIITGLVTFKPEKLL